MDEKENDYLNDNLQKTNLYKLKPTIYHAYVLPFVIFYLSWTLIWASLWGIREYFEMGMIVYAIIGLFQILCCLFCFWIVEIRCLFTCSKVDNIREASHVQVVPAPNNGSPELVPLQRQIEEEKVTYYFEFQKTVFIYDSDEKKRFSEVVYPSDWTLEKYMEWKGYLEEEQVIKAEKHYGLNNLKMDIPKFMDLFKERATAPFFVFQVFCVSLWCLEEYWYYSIFTLVMLIIFEATLVQQQLKNMAEIRKMGNQPYPIQVFRNRKWRQILSDRLVPGDLVSIGRSQNERLVPCDLLLLRGPCIVDEAMLTGESVPVMKEPIENVDLKDYFSFDNHGKLHVLYGGTKVVQHTPPPKTGPGIKATDNGCVAFVLRHSFSTSQGKLLKTILFGVKRVTANNLETFVFILFLLIFAITAASYVWVVGSQNPTRNKYKLFLECTLILTSVVPPELPIELSLAVNASLLALSKLYVFCTEPFRIPFAGKIDICCFDKTGTLTSDDLVVQGVAGLNSEKEDEICSPSDLPLEITQVLATCHSLVQLEDQLVGDPLEKTTLASIQWNLTKGDAVVPKKAKIDQHGFKIFQRFHFSSALKRMSVIAGHTPSGSTDTHYLASVKGAPEVIRDMLVEVPATFDKIYLNFARQGARVLALAYRDLGTLSHQELREMSREAVETSLHFAGFLIISCPLKMDSKAVIKEIQHSSHHVVMITGDNPLTACHVSSELRITRRNHNTLILTHSNPKTLYQFNGDSDQEWQWISIDESTKVPLIKDDAKELKQISSYNLCLTGEGIDYLATYHSSLFEKILPSVRVHARVAPKQKEFIINTLKRLGFVTLMCGDGTNDVGALRHADVGVALLANAPERIHEKKSRKEERMNNQSTQNIPPPPNQLMVGSVPRKGKHHSFQKPPHSFQSQGELHDNNAAKKLNELMKRIEEEEKAQVVKLGDASIASPFTSKLSTALCVCHIIKQGRCTLVTTLQMFKILALNALILAYSQSVLYLDGVKFSDTQATVQGLLLAGCFFFISKSKPLEILSKERPLPNIFNLYTLLTILFQFAIHFSSLIYLKTESEIRSPFNKTEEGFINLEEDFKPNLINSCIYIISIFMQVTTFAVNYKGHPFMASLIENKPLLYSLLGAALAIVSLATGLMPEFATYVEMVPLDSELSNKILIVLVFDFFGCLILDRLLQLLLSRAPSKININF